MRPGTMFFQKDVYNSYNFAQRETNGPPHWQDQWVSFFMLRAGFFIDGFNVYGAICELVKSDLGNGLRPPHFLKCVTASA